MRDIPQGRFQLRAASCQGGVCRSSRCTCPTLSIPNRIESKRQVALGNVTHGQSCEDDAYGTTDSLAAGSSQLEPRPALALETSRQECHGDVRRGAFQLYTLCVPPRLAFTVLLQALATPRMQLAWSIDICAPVDMPLTRSHSRLFA
jgi:hypothetical protein